MKSLFLVYVNIDAAQIELRADLTDTNGKEYTINQLFQPGSTSQTLIANLRKFATAIESIQKVAP